MSVIHSRRQLAHNAACASGARAEQRAACDCSAAERPALWTIDVLAATDANGRHLVRVEAQGLAWTDVGLLALELEDVGRWTAQELERSKTRKRRSA